MTFKKNWISYILWGLYAILSCIGFFGVLFCILNDTPLKSIYAKAGVACLSIAVIIGIFTLARFAINNTRAKKQLVLVEAFVVVLLLGIGIFLRVCHLDLGDQEAAYFEVAKVTGMPISPVAHGVQYYYLLLLRGLFLISGNFFVAGIILQVSLQCIAGIIWYFIVRKYAGSLAGIVFLSIIMLFPNSIHAAITYSPKILYLIMFGVVLAAIGSITGSIQKNKDRNAGFWIKLIFTGILTGALVYLDITGILLFVPIVFICFVDKNSGEDNKKKLPASMICFGLIVIVAALFFAVSLWIDSIMNQVSYGKVFQVWSSLFQYKGLISLNELKLILPGMNKISIWMTLAIALFAMLGIPGFFVIKKTEIQLLWFVMALGGITLWACEFHYAGMTGEQLIFFILAALSGAGLQTVSRRKHLEEEVELPMEQTILKDNGDEVDSSLTEPEKPQIQYIENPLPLPKKTVKKTMDYKIEVDLEQMKYDIEMNENDDFDIK